LHRIRDPEGGEEIIVVTAPMPARGIAREHSFVDLQLLESAHGLALVPRSDDLAVEIVPNGVGIARPGGLHLTDDGSVASVASPETGGIFGALSWRIERGANFRRREAELLATLVAAAPSE
jgi:hypothetical protein